MSELSCAVILCTRNRPEMLADALDAVAPTLRSGDELVVVDSASDTDQTRRVADDRGVRVVRAERKGLSRARNLGVAATMADIVVFTDDDCRPQAGWLDRLTDGFADDQVGFVLGQVRADVADAHLPFDAARPRPAARFSGPTDPIELGNGACMAFRRAAYEACGGADERLGAGTRLQSAEDHDLFCRLLHHRWIGAYDPDALVLHRDWRTHREVVKYNWGVGLGTGAMVGKLWRVADTQTVRPLLRRRLVTDGVVELARNIAHRDKSAIVAHTLKLGGTLAGLSIGLVLRRDGERFRST
jgi:glycosyltransferase involved in cell wall biosynthesis